MVNVMCVLGKDLKEAKRLALDKKVRKTIINAYEALEDMEEALKNAERMCTRSLVKESLAVLKEIGLRL